jgi:putative DNA primase/helicase
MTWLNPTDLQRLRTAATSRRVAQLLGVELKGDGTGRCPFHEDTNPSFKAYDGGGWKCFAGCGSGPDGLSLWLKKSPGRFPEAAKGLAERLGISLRDGSAKRRLAPKPISSAARSSVPWEPSSPPPANLRHRQLGVPDRLHLVRDTAGRLFGAHARWYRPGGKKEMRWWRQGSWSLGGLNVAETPLYGAEHLASSNRSAPLFIVEGETACDALHALGIAAVATVCGAASLPGRGVLADLTGWNGTVILWADADEPGWSHMSRLARALQGKVREVRIFRPDDAMPAGGDAVDWIEARSGQPLLDLRTELMATAVPPASAPLATEGAREPAGGPRGTDRFPDYDLETFLRLENPPRQWIAEGLIAERGLAMVDARRGTGKTHFVLGLACAIAAGKPFLRYRVPAPAGILLVDGGMPAPDLQECLRLHVESGASPEAPLRLLCADLAEGNLPSLATPEGQKLIERKLTSSIKLLILDSVSTLCHNDDASVNDAASWDAIQAWLLRLRRQGFAVLIVHHGGKDGKQRGTSKRDVLDQVLLLQQPSDDQPSEGARFEVRLEKGRQVKGDLAEPYEATLISRESAALWTWKLLRAGGQGNEIRELALAGATVRGIAEELGLPATTVYRAIQRMREQGDLPTEAGRRKRAL